MKLFDVDINAFQIMIQSCKGQVTIVTEDGDRMVTNSMLSALVGFSKILEVASIKEIEFECENPEDSVRILNFIMQYSKQESN